MEWKKRRNGVTPGDSWVSNNDLKQHDPITLINYYESRIKTI